MLPWRRPLGGVRVLDVNAGRAGRRLLTNVRLYDSARGTFPLSERHLFMAAPRPARPKNESRDALLVSLALAIAMFSVTLVLGAHL